MRAKPNTVTCFILDFLQLILIIAPASEGQYCNLEYRQAGEPWDQFFGALSGPSEDMVADAFRTYNRNQYKEV